MLLNVHGITNNMEFKDLILSRMSIHTLLMALYVVLDSEFIIHEIRTNTEIRYVNWIHMY